MRSEVSDGRDSRDPPALWVADAHHKLPKVRSAESCHAGPTKEVQSTGHDPAPAGLTDRRPGSCKLCVSPTSRSSLKYLVNSCCIHPPRLFDI